MQQSLRSGMSNHWQSDTQKEHLLHHLLFSSEPPYCSVNESNFSTGLCYVNLQACKGGLLGCGELEKAQGVQEIKINLQTYAL